MMNIILTSEKMLFNIYDIGEAITLKLWQYSNSTDVDLINNLKSFYYIIVFFS